MARGVRGADADRRLRKSHDGLVLGFLQAEMGAEALRAGTPRGRGAAFQTALSLDRRVFPAQLALAELWLEREPARAAAVLEAAIAAAPERAYLAFAPLQRAYAAAGEPSRFVSTVRTAASAQDPRDWRARLALARHVRAEGKPAEALGLLLRALESNPHVLLVHLEVWRTLRELGRARPDEQRYLETVERLGALRRPAHLHRLPLPRGRHALALPALPRVEHHRRGAASGPRRAGPEPASDASRGRRSGRPGERALGAAGCRRRGRQRHERRLRGRAPPAAAAPGRRAGARGRAPPRRGRRRLDARAGGASPQRMASGAQPCSRSGSVAGPSPRATAKAAKAASTGAPAIDSPSTWVSRQTDAAAPASQSRSWPHAAAHSASATASDSGQGAASRSRGGAVPGPLRRAVRRRRARAAELEAGYREGVSQQRRRGESARPGAVCRRERARQRRPGPPARGRAAAPRAAQLTRERGGSLLGLRGVARAVDEGVREAPLLGDRHLGLDPRPRRGLGEPVAVHQPLELLLGAAVHHDQPLEAQVRARLHEQRRVADEHARAPRLERGGAPSALPRARAGARARRAGRAGRRVREHERAERAPVERAVGARTPLPNSASTSA